MDPTLNDQPTPEPHAPQRITLEVYRVAIDDLHHTKDLGQKIDNMYVTIITLLLTADAYEIATTQFNNSSSAIATAGVAIIGLAVTGRWRKGASNLFEIVTNRYSWLRDAEQYSENMRDIGANIFTQEYAKVYDPQIQTGKRKSRAKDSRSPRRREPGFLQFYNRTVLLQSLCELVFIAIPVILSIVTYLHMTPSFLQSIGQSIERIIP